MVALIPSCYLADGDRDSLIPFLFFFLVLLGPHLQAAYGGSQAKGPVGTVATGQRRILNPLGKAMDQTCILTDASRFRYC